MKLSKYIKSKLLWAYRFSRGNIAIYEGRFMRYVWIPSMDIVYAWDYVTEKLIEFENCDI